jgi:hypothetical protein
MYYAVLHEVLIAAADLFVGRVRRRTDRYRIVYRSVDHGRLKMVCEQATNKSRPFGADIAAFSIEVVQLQQKRHSADYDPLYRPLQSDARVQLQSGRAAVRRFRRAAAADREAFLTQLLFKERK